MSGRDRFPEGWYLMSTETVERTLRLWRSGADVDAMDASRLTTEEALAYRNAGNLPDDRGRTLRLLLLVKDRHDVENLGAKRSLYEPDFQDAPTWRRGGSKPVNVVPLRENVEPAADRPWWEEPDLAALEAEWGATGAIAGLAVPEETRGFVYKTILSLRAAGREVTVDSVADSLERWLSPVDAAGIRSTLERANPPAREP